MKNLMKAPMRITTESWPRRKPSVKERLENLASQLWQRGEDHTKIVVVLEKAEMHLESS